MQGLGLNDFINLGAGITQMVIAIALCVMAVAYVARKD